MTKLWETRNRHTVLGKNAENSLRVKIEDVNILKRIIPNQYKKRLYKREKKWKLNKKQFVDNTTISKDNVDENSKKSKSSRLDL